MSFRVGVSSSFIEEAAWAGVETIIKTVRSHGGEVPFIVSTRKRGENSTTDRILSELEKEEIPLICVSFERYRKSGEKDWRKIWGEKVLRQLGSHLPVDFVFLFGDMTIWPENMCRELKGANLHPDTPGRFPGEWWEVISQVVRNRVEEAGVMIHLVTPRLDQGPVITYCRFSLRGPTFDPLWDSLPKDPLELEKLISEQRERKQNPNHRLWQEIRRQGLIREFPLIEKTITAFAEGKIRIENGIVVDEMGREVRGGRDLTLEIEEMVRPILEGRPFGRKEIGF